MTSIVQLSPLQLAQLDPHVIADPDNPKIARTASGQQVALTPPRMADFLESLMTMGSVAIACQRAGVARQTAYRARRRSPGFARAWDAALIAARTVAESELAERAINGVEEAVFYHGEEVARRRHFDSRLLLAHLARLDRAAERLDLAATLPQLDDQIAALRLAGEGAGEGDVDAVLPGAVAAEDLRRVQDERELVRDPAGFAEREAAEKEKAVLRQAQHERGFVQGRQGAEKSPQEPVTPVTPCEDCGGFCLDAETEPGVTLTQADCQWLGNRLERMEEARPEDALPPFRLCLEGDRTGALEMAQLHAFEAGVPRWWALAPEEAQAALENA
ncbi:hypothetical protein D2V17_07300 [Aurantiacibacter xanthus]|uniref:Uncharacterized protein n=1 Tax=Aurantiacibacter xanthus TaxID=1784712 RepID=A0A3A1P6V8_9SPHN|nr:hypothetical protein [Aurantiacibacter xanthus]RIV88682.1 hypothetical protein D2V17_07300 [Aurantiacibacter xanthus]